MIHVDVGRGAGYGERLASFRRENVTSSIVTAPRTSLSIDMQRGQNHSGCDLIVSSITRSPPIDNKGLH